MKEESLEFLRKLVGTPSPSGFEWNIQSVIRQRLAGFAGLDANQMHKHLLHQVLLLFEIVRQLRGNLV